MKWQKTKYLFIFRWNHYRQNDLGWNDSELKSLETKWQSAGEMTADKMSLVSINTIIVNECI